MCTEFRLKGSGSKPTIVTGRSMDYELEVVPTMYAQPRGRHIKTVYQDPQHPHKDPVPGIEWTVKYGHIYVGEKLKGTKIPKLPPDYIQYPAFDGINEKGLSCAALYLPGYTKYQKVAKKQHGIALPNIIFVNWVLANYANVDDLATDLRQGDVVRVWPFPIKYLDGDPLPFHYSVYQASEGRGIVVEFVDGEVHVHENKIGILTNSPTYDWQLSNVSNYVNLSPFEPNDVSIGGVKFSPIGLGAGLLGLPGDPTPPSRFIRTLFLTANASPTCNTEDTLNLAGHVLNALDLPKGFESHKRNPSLTNYTQWAVMRDHTHRTYYFRRYTGMSWQKVVLDDVDLKRGKPLQKAALDPYHCVKDISHDFKPTKRG